MPKRVRFYSAFDLSCGINLVKCENILKNFNDKMRYDNINDIIELNNIKKFFDNGLYLKSWSEDTMKLYKSYVEQISKIIGKFFGGINNTNILEIVQKTEEYYMEDFWEMFSYYKLNKKISSDKFIELLNISKNIYLWYLTYVLQFQNIVKFFDKEIKTTLMNTPINAEIIIKKYMEAPEEGEKPIYFPESLTLDDKENLLKQYINYKDANLNFIRLISEFNCNNENEFRLSGKTRLYAKKRYEKDIGELIKARKNTQSSFIIRKIPNITILSENNIKWIKENMDYPTLLNNFIYIFDFVDIQMRSNFVHKRKEIGIVEKTLSIQGKDYYYTGRVFNKKAN